MADKELDARAEEREAAQIARREAALSVLPEELVSKVEVIAAAEESDAKIPEGVRGDVIRALAEVHVEASPDASAGQVTASLAGSFSDPRQEREFFNQVWKMKERQTREAERAERQLSP